jgi:hypothetical protein
MRILRSLFAAQLLALHLVGAAQDTNTQPIGAPPRTNRSTPEDAVKSYWAVKDWSQRTHEVLAAQRKERAYVERRFLDSVSEVTTGETLRWFQDLKPSRPDEISRTILSTTFDAQERAHVAANVRNVSPIPPGANPTQMELERKAKGKNVTYVLVRSTDGWKIGEVWADEFGERRRLYDRSPPLAPIYVYGD